MGDPALGWLAELTRSRRLSVLMETTSGVELDISENFSGVRQGFWGP